MKRYSLKNREMGKLSKVKAANVMVRVPVMEDVDVPIETIELVEEPL